MPLAFAVFALPCAMFTGIVESTGTVQSITFREGGARFVVQVGPMARELALGESVAVNGCCLTVTQSDPQAGTAAFDLLIETLKVTSLGRLHEGSVVNLERALRIGDRLSGHFVQGHVDATASVVALKPVGKDHEFVVELPAAWARLVVHKGSVCIDGMSLTVAELGADRMTFWITPHTFEVTNLRTVKAGDAINLEFDMLAKHLERLQDARTPAPSGDRDTLVKS
jgi:riboflavin synthase